MSAETVPSFRYAPHIYGLDLLFDIHTHILEHQSQYNIGGHFNSLLFLKIKLQLESTAKL